jgi:AcrR family transcriptional regulator
MYSRKKKSTAVRREEIIAATLRVIGERGAGSVTTAAIADAAGMSEANIYRHFNGKVEVFRALGDFIGTLLMSRAAAIAAGSGRPVEKLKMIFMRHVALVAENPGLPRFIFSEEVHLKDRGLAEAMRRRMESYLETLAGLITAGVVEGDFRRGIASRETAMTMLGMISVTALRWSLSGCAFDIKVVSDQLWGNFITIIGHDKSE